MNDPVIKLTPQDLTHIRSLAIKEYEKLMTGNPHEQDDLRAKAWAIAVSGWLRSKGHLKIILD